MATPAAGMAASTVVPEGGSFEQTPLVYSTSDECGLLCTISTTRQAEGSNHYLHTAYASLLGVIGTSEGEATITSPQFTWTQATPSAVALAFSRRSSLGGLAGLNNGASFHATLVDETTSTSSTIASESMTSSEPAFHDYSVSVAPGLLQQGHAYRLVIGEGFDALLGAATTASVDLDNVGLDVTLSPHAASVGATSVSTPTEHSVSASASVNAYGEEATYALQYGTSTSYGSQTQLQTIPAGVEGVQQIGAGIEGLQPGTTYHARFVVSDGGGTSYGPDVTFTTAAASPPTLGSAAVGSVSASGAIVSATVNPGASATSVKVNYGTSTAYGQSTATQTIPAGSGATGVQIPLSGLAPSTTYHAQVVASNADGATESQDLVFTTAASGSGGAGGPATIGATNVAGVHERSATVQAGVNPHGEAAEYEVEYGTSTSYGQRVKGTIAAGSSGAQAIAAPISGLTPGTSYHARLVVTDGGGTSEGMDVVFTTAPVSPPAIAAASVGEVSESAATVSATVDPGANETSVKVNYGTSTAYGQSTAIQTLAAGSGASGVQIPLSGLVAETTYHLEVVASNVDGSSESRDLTFTTPSGTTGGAGAGSEPPSITGSAVEGETSQSAIAHASINPHGQAASYEVQYGSSAAYGALTSSGSLPAQSTGAPVTVALNGLQPGSLYHARFRVVTANGTSYGPDVTFSTLGSSTGPGGSGGGSGGGGSSTATAAGSSEGAGAGAGGSGVRLSGTSATRCLQVQTKRRGLAARLLSVAGTVRISPSHPLRVTLVRAARAVGAVSYSIGGGALRSASGRVVEVLPSQLRSGERTVLRLLLSAPRVKRRSLSVTLTATSCAAVLRVLRSAGQLRVTVRRIDGSRRVTLTLPANVGTLEGLTLITITKNRFYRARTAGGRIRLAPRAGSVGVMRSGATLTVANLSSSITGLVLSFPMQRGAHGAVFARVVSAGGSVQSLHATLR